MQNPLVHATKLDVTARDRRWAFEQHTSCRAVKAKSPHGPCLIFYDAGIYWLKFQRLSESRSFA
jgi:hypothetical protein